MGVAAGVATSATLANSAVSSLALANNAPTNEAAQAKPIEHQLTINIQMNKDGLEDWVLIENMTEAPIIMRSIEPRYVSYGEKVIDLRALLSRQQRGKNQLEIWPNYAWSHSVVGASRQKHPLRPTATTTYKAEMNQDSRSLQIKARADSKGRITLLS